jgi:hypothetical protein
VDQSPGTAPPQAPIVIPCRSEPERLIRGFTTSEAEAIAYELRPGCIR